VTTPSYKTSAARRLAAALLGAATIAGAACSNDRFTEPNRNQPSLTGAQNDPNFVQFAASGVLAANRNQLDDYVRDVGVFGREIFNYTQTEGRNTSGFLATFSDNAGFGAGLWGLRYNNLRNIFNLNQFVEQAQYVPLSDAGLQEARERFQNRTTGTAPEDALGAEEKGKGKEEEKK